LARKRRLVLGVLVAGLELGDLRRWSGKIDRDGERGLIDLRRGEGDEREEQDRRMQRRRNECALPHDPRGVTLLWLSWGNRLGDERHGNARGLDPREHFCDGAVLGAIVAPDLDPVPRA